MAHGHLNRATLNNVQSRDFSSTSSHETPVLLAHAEFKRMVNTKIKHLLYARITSLNI